MIIPGFFLYVAFSVVLTVCIHSLVMPWFRSKFGPDVVRPLFCLNTGVSCAITLYFFLPLMMMR